MVLFVFERFRRKKSETEPKTRDPYFDTPEGRAELEAYFKTPDGADALREALKEDIDRRQPSLREALWADACIYSSLLMHPPTFSTKLGFVREALRLSWSSDAFFCMALYRIRTRLIVRHVPVLPTVLHRLCMTLAQLNIGNAVVIEPGVYIPHGQVVIDGMIRIGSGSVIAPWVTLGRYGPALEGPALGKNVFIGTGAKLFGPIKVGDGARIGANAVVVSDVEPHTTVAGAPAKKVRDRRSEQQPPPAAAESGQVFEESRS